MSDIVNELYTDSAELGKIYSNIGIILGILIFSVLCMSGIYNVMTPDVKKQTEAKIIKVNSCDPRITTTNNSKTNQTTTSTTYDCVLTVSYSVNGVSYSNNIILSRNTQYNVDEIVTISYEIANPNNISEASASNSTLASISMCIGITILLGCGINYYFTTHSKIYASATGISGTVNVLKSITN